MWLLKPFNNTCGYLQEVWDLHRKQSSHNIYCSHKQFEDTQLLCLAIKGTPFTIGAVAAASTSRKSNGFTAHCYNCNFVLLCNCVTVTVCYNWRSSRYQPAPAETQWLHGQGQFLPQVHSCSCQKIANCVQNCNFIFQLVTKNYIEKISSKTSQTRLPQSSRCQHQQKPKMASRPRPIFVVASNALLWPPKICWLRSQS